MNFIGKALESLAESTFGQMISSLISSLYSWVSGIVDFIASWWLGINPLGVDEGTAAYRVAEIASPFVAWVGIPALMIALVRASRHQGATEDTSQIVNGLFRTVIFGAAGMAGTHLLMVTSSAVAPWIYDTMTAGVDEDLRTVTSMFNLESVDMAVDGAIAGLLIVCLPFMLIASVIQAMMALGSDIVANVLGATLAVTAAASTTKAGEAALKKQVAWILSCVAFKPVAALLYGFGISLVHGSNFLESARSEDGQNPMLGILMGTMCVILVCFSLPALVKLLVPLAGVLGSSGGRFMSAMAGVAGGAAFQAFSSSSSSGTSTSEASRSSASASEATGAGMSAAGASSSGAAGSSASAAGAEAAGGAATAGTTIAIQETAKAAEAAGNTAKNVAAEAASSETGAGHDASSASESTPANTKGTETDTNGDASAAPALGDDDSSSSGHPTESGFASEDSASAGTSGSPGGGLGTEEADFTSADSSTPAPTENTGAGPEQLQDEGASGSADFSAAAESGAVASSEFSAQGSADSTGSSERTSFTEDDSSPATGSSSSSGSSSTGSAEQAGAPHTSRTAASEQTPYIKNSGYTSNSGPSGYLAQQYLTELTRAAGEETSGAIQAEGAGI
ncbi:hypothetical protein [Rothia nasimurium]|uniref:hypothetical protein n=1 Tax=Rothia nasimurium TaxID=85336 RepID=UPI003B9FCDD8